MAEKDLGVFLDKEPHRQAFTAQAGARLTVACRRTAAGTTLHHVASWSATRFHQSHDEVGPGEPSRTIFLKYERFRDDQPGLFARTRSVTQSCGLVVGGRTDKRNKTKTEDEK